MIGDALKFSHDCAKPSWTRRTLDSECRFDSAGEGDAIGDSAVARSAGGEHCRAIKRCARHYSLNALVHVAEALFQSNHRFAVDGETEVSWLDYAGMHRPDRYLMKTFTFSRQKLIGRRRRLRFGPTSKRVLHTPAAVVQPRPPI